MEEERERERKEGEEKRAMPRPNARQVEPQANRVRTLTPSNKRRCPVLSAFQSRLDGI